MSIKMPMVFIKMYRQCRQRGTFSVLVLSLITTIFLISNQSAIIHHLATREVTGTIGYQGATTKIDFTVGRYGKRIKGTDHLIVYNRVPKCGSRTLLALFDQLKKEGHFYNIISTQGFRIPPNLDFTQGQEALKKIINQRIDKTHRLPSTIEGHFRFHDVDRSKKPIYINLLRDPLDRMVSQYYYRRFGDAQTSEEFLKKELRKVIAPEHINQTFNECVLSEREECSIPRVTSFQTSLDRMISQYYYRRFGDAQTSEEFLKKELRKVIAPEHINQTFNECVLSEREECSIPRVTSFQTSFFCGIHPNCSIPSEWALARAKKHVIENYSVVGTVDDYKGFLAVLEKLMPSLFDGLSVKYINQIKSRGHNKTESTKSFKLAPPTPEVEKIMRQRLDMEYKFYNFVQDRFEQLKIHLGVAS